MTPDQPMPGELVVGCVHEPDPHGAHVIRVDPGLPIALLAQPVARWQEGLSHWLFVCDACFAQYGATRQVPIGRAGYWPEGAAPLAYARRS